MLLATGIGANALTFNLGSAALQNSGAIVKPNTCLNNLAKNIANGACKNPNGCYVLSNPKSSIVYKVVEKQEDLNKLFNITGSANVAYGPVDGTLSGSYGNTLNTMNRTINMVFVSEVRWDAALAQSITEGTANPAEAIVVSQQANVKTIIDGGDKAQDAINKFVKACGDSYVSAASAGFILITRIDVEADSVEDKTAIAADLKVNLALGGGSGASSAPSDSATAGAPESATQGTGKAGLALAIVMNNDNIKKSSKVSVYLEQFGGNPQSLAKILMMKNGKTIKDGEVLPVQGCGLATPEAKANCFDVLRSAMGYINDELDADGAPKNNGQLYDGNGNIDFSKLYYFNTEFTPYENIDLVYQTPAKVTDTMQEIVKIRQALEDEIANIDNILARYSAASHINDPTVATLNTARASIKKDLGKMDPTLPTGKSFKNCFSPIPDVPAGSCKTAFDVARTSLKNAVTQSAAFKTLEPWLVYKIQGVPMLGSKDGVVDGKWVLDYAKCDMLLTGSNPSINGGSNVEWYSLYCRNYPTDGKSNPQVTVANDATNGLLLQDFGAGYRTCTTGGLDNGLTCYKFNIALSKDQTKNGYALIDNANSSIDIKNDPKPLFGTSAQAHAISFFPGGAYQKATANQLSEAYAEALKFVP